VRKEASEKKPKGVGGFYVNRYEKSLLSSLGLPRLERDTDPPDAFNGTGGGRPRNKVHLDETVVKGAGGGLTGRVVGLDRQ